MLLGLLDVDCLALTILKEVGVDARSLRSELESKMKAGKSKVTSGQLPFTPCAKRALELAMEEGEGLDHFWLGTEHLLLGLARTEGIVGESLTGAGADIMRLREKTREFVGTPPEMPRPSTSRSSPRKSDRLDVRLRILDEAATALAQMGETDLAHRLRLTIAKHKKDGTLGEPPAS